MPNPARVYLHHDDLPETVTFQDHVAIDTETMGLQPERDRLCLVQLSQGDGVCHLVKLSNPIKDAPNLKRWLLDPSIEKIFHYARFDLEALYVGLGVLCVWPIFCTKIASFLTRTYTDRHGLKTLCWQLLRINLEKGEQCSDWGAAILSEQQKRYAASDVAYLVELRHILLDMAVREGRLDLLEQCCRFLPTRTLLDSAGFRQQDLFSH